MQKIMDSHLSPIHQLLDIALNTPRETADVFFTHWAHIQCVEVRIFVGGWSDKNNEPQFEKTLYMEKAESLLSNVQGFLASINPSESKRKAAQDRLEKARAELLAAEVEAGALNAWTPESGELIPFEDLLAYSVVDEPTRGPWLDSQEAEDHKTRSQPI